MCFAKALVFFGDETYRVVESNAEVAITVARTGYMDKSVQVGRYYSDNNSLDIFQVDIQCLYQGTTTGWFFPLAGNSILFPLIQNFAIEKTEVVYVTGVYQDFCMKIKMRES